MDILLCTHVVFLTFFLKAFCISLFNLLSANYGIKIKILPHGNKWEFFWKNSMHAACLYAFDKFFWLVIDYVIIVYFFE